jgi:hypothetical protein
MTRRPPYRDGVRLDRRLPASRHGTALPPPEPRDVVDHALARRALLRAVAGGGLLTTVSPSDVCDASKELLRAAEEAGTDAGRACPLCAHPLREVAWVFGASLGSMSGTPRAPRQLAALAVMRPEFDVYEVEVCAACRWNHLLRTWRAGRREA